jgi:serine phosphatase RsbU (regulator of sigma subunit)/catechol 2,3-dioxygenase-like lactoylglutathione lyase family enzyme
MGSASLTRTVLGEELRPDHRDKYLRMDAVNVFVSDLDESLKFYIDQLGFHLALDVRLQSGHRLVAVAPPDGTATLRLIVPIPGSEEYKLIGRQTQVVFLAEDVIAKFAEWRSRGVKFKQTPRLKRIRYREQEEQPDAPIWGGVFARFEDIDGNLFSLVGFDEVSRQLELQRRAIADRQEAERRTAQEIEIAKQVQARLFPQTLPFSNSLEYCGTCIQALQVGGDYYDFLHLGQDRLGLVIGDIAGKGIAAALLMANLQANLRSQYAVALECPQEFLRSVNHLFYQNSIESAYATLFYGEYEDQLGRLRYVNCGHLPGLVLRGDDSVERLESTSTVVGLFEEWDCSLGECHLLRGDTLVLYTDGVTESFNDQYEEFGEQRLVNVLRTNRGASPQTMMTAVLDEVKQFSPNQQHDDVTLIVARRKS